jgi:hypothetical protein
MTEPVDPALGQEREIESEPVGTNVDLVEDEYDTPAVEAGEDDSA